MDGVYIGEGAYVRRAILDKNVVVPPWARIGVDTVADRSGTTSARAAWSCSARAPAR